MKGFVVQLREDGLFEAKPAFPGESSVRVVCEPADQRMPWVALSLDADGLKWTRLRGFHSLDEALDFAVEQAHWDGPLHGYSVRMPDGMAFQRPGRLPVEQVMASAGWFFVTSLVGYAMVTADHGSNAMEVRSEMLRRLEGSDARIGDVNPSDEDSEGRHWCIDLDYPYEGFIHVDDVRREAQAAFAADGIEVIPHFDFRPRTSLAVKEAAVIAFPEDRIVRRMTAA